MDVNCDGTIDQTDVDTVFCFYIGDEDCCEPHGSCCLSDRSCEDTTHDECDLQGGTFDYFTEAINGKSQACRADFTASADDNVLVQGVGGDEYSLGFFGFAYYVQNQDKLRVVPIDKGKGATAPSMATINDGSYAPLSRPIFIYVSTEAAKRPEVDAFVNFYLENAGTLAAEVGYVALPDPVVELASARYAERVAGSVFNREESKGKTLEEVLASGH
jgi:phosphate transport system substrate-binding protein